MQAQPQAWCSLPLSEEEQELIRVRVQDLARRFCDPVYNSNVSQLASYQSKYHLWLPGQYLHSLSHGPAGVALLYGELDRTFPGEHWDQIAHKHLTLLQQTAIPEGQCGLLSGICGVLFVTQRLSRQGTRYRKLRNQLEASLLPTLLNFIEKFPRDERPQSSHYDLPEGAVGIGLTLLTLAEEAETYQPGASSAVLPALTSILRHLSWVGLQVCGTDKHRFDHWYRSTELQTDLTAWANCYYGCGIRTGLAGHIALLSLAARSSLHLEEAAPVSDALSALCLYLRQQMRKDADGWCWPQEQVSGKHHRPGSTAAFAWCNGKVGIARAFWLAADVLDDNELRTLAQECIAEATHSWRQDPLLFGPSLCHGLAGLLQVCLRFVHETGDASLGEEARCLLMRLLEMFDPGQPFGYRVYEPDYIRTDFPWLLEGASGVTLALLASISSEPPAWDRILLLS